MPSWFEKIFMAQKPARPRFASLDTRFDPRISIQQLRNYCPSLSDIFHYGFLGSILLFVFVVNPASLINKFLLLITFILLCFIPITGQFVFNAFPIFTWLALYFTSSSFDTSYRPPITVKVLPAVETILYGDNLSDILAASTNTTLDLITWLPYGIFHFGAPFVVAGTLFLFGPPTILRGYSFAFGYMNLFGVIIQNIFPAAPPWYKLLYGLSPANYSMKGSPGGLSRIDEYFGVNIYTQGFSNSAVVFGALPSLHSGCATMEALFMTYAFPNLKPLFIIYVCWLWWSTMYLTHHYFVDLMAGSVLAYVIFQYTKFFHLPIVDDSLFSRWSYGEIHKFSITRMNPLYQDHSDLEDMPLTPMEMDFELSSMTNTITSSTPSIFDETGTRSVSRSSVNSIDLLDEESARTAPSKLSKQRIE